MRRRQRVICIAVALRTRFRTAISSVSFIHIINILFTVGCSDQLTIKPNSFDSQKSKCIIKMEFFSNVFSPFTFFELF